MVIDLSLEVVAQPVTTTLDSKASAAARRRAYIRVSMAPPVVFPLQSS
jgi:hypothetical protein